jgi:hypothetical protein
MQGGIWYDAVCAFKLYKKVVPVLTGAFCKVQSMRCAKTALCPVTLTHTACCGCEPGEPGAG